MQQLQQELLLESKQNMLTPMGEGSLHDDEIKDIAGVIVASIVGGAWAAMDEWGTGSLMDESNPALQNYKNSELWNPARTDNKIRTRPKGPYTDIFGNQKVSKAPVEGIDMEELGIVTPYYPSHAIQTAARWMANGRMQSKIRSVVKSFPFGKFIICDNK